MVLIAVCLVLATCLTTAAAADAPVTVDASLVVGEVELDNGSIFLDEEIKDSPGGLRFVYKTMNALHIDTREWVIRQELLFKQGDRFNPELLAETERNLRSLGFLNKVRVTAVDTTADGKVNVRVSVRETWTLQTNFAYSRAGNGDQRWNVQLSERNFLGLGTTLGLGAGADENRSFWNGWFRQRRLFRSKLILGIDYAQSDDGNYTGVFLSQPFYALSDGFGMDLRVWENVLDQRYFLSNAGPAGSDPAAEASLYATIPYSEVLIEGRFQFRVAGRDSGRVWRVGSGLRLTDREYDLDDPPYEISDGTWQDLGWLLDPGQPLTREQGLRVFPYIWVHSEGRTWTRARFVNQYGPDEDLSLFWNLDAMVGPTGEGVGSTAGQGTSLRLEATLSRWWRTRAGYFVLRAEGEGELGEGVNRYHRFDIIAGWVGQAGAENSPWLTRVFAEIGQGYNLTGGQAFRLGLDRGLRTLDYDGMAGDRLVRWNVEEGKVMAHELLGLFRMGLAAFYDGGLARWSDEDRDLSDARHEAGLGLRFGPTRSTNAMITRLDVTWDLQGGSPVFTAITRGFF